MTSSDRPAGTVLVAEDEEAVRRLVVLTLTRRGYSVLVARDGAEALERVEEHEGPIDLLVTDVVMPRMRGPELADRLRAACPSIKVLFMSGYAGANVLAEATAASGTDFLAKPFTPTELMGRVGALLDVPSG